MSGRAAAVAARQAPTRAARTRATARRAAQRIALGALLAAAAATPCRAEEGDGAYGRLDGDLDLSLGAGAALAAGAPAFVARATSVYAEMAGAHIEYTDSFGQAGARIDRSAAAGVTLKPLFWLRFSKGWETWNPRVDLFFDSFVFEVGAFWAAPRGRSIEAEPGLELAMGLGVPLFADATGPWLEVRGAFRYRREDLTGLVPGDIADRGAMLAFTLAWHHVVPVHIADAGDRLTR